MVIGDASTHYVALNPLPHCNAYYAYTTLYEHPQILKLASGTHTEWILNRDKKHNEIYQKVTKSCYKGKTLMNK